MAEPAERHQLAVDLLGIRPADQVLEIGCGHGIATGLALQKLTTGALVAVDRSAKMTAATAKRNTGPLTVLTGTVETLDVPHRFDRIFAVNVDFPRHKDLGWAKALNRLLKPKGTIVLLLEAPTDATADRFGTGTEIALQDEGFTTERIERPKIVAIRAFR